jgi:hypothetical protein
MRLQFKSKLNLLVLPVIVVAAITVLSVFSILNTNKNADALSAISNFKAGNIIDDSVFYNKDTMNAQQIQEFLNQLLPNCDTWGTGSSGYGNLNNAQYAQQIMGWHGPPYACLKNYHENPTSGETSYERGGGAFPGGVSAAQIIYNAAQDYGINPQVLLVLLKKESAGPLTADSWPLKNQYRFAMGYGCPDSGPGNSANCTTQRAGFYKQMTTAAWQLKYYKDNANSYRYKVGWNDIQYSPSTACGTKRVYIENIATLSLYIYTPYTPNDASLTNYPGTANCGSYGNRNFFMFFNEWFGSTRSNPFSSMDVSRKLVAKTDTAKVNPSTGVIISGQNISKGQVVEYSSKTNITANGALCLRTASNTVTNQNMCVLYKDLQEGPAFSDLNGSVSLVTNSPIPKINPIDNSPVPNQIIQPGQIIEYSSKTYTLNDNSECLRTKSNTATGLPACVLRNQLSDLPSFKPLTKPRELVAIGNISKINPFTGENINGQFITKGTIVKYLSEITILKDNTRCYRTEANTYTNVSACVPLASLKEYIDPQYNDMVVKRDLITNKATNKIDPTTGETIEKLPSGLRISFSQLTYHGGKLCLRTTTDKTLNKLTCVLYDNLKEL